MTRANLARYRLQAICVLVGMIGGYLLLHPYAMLVYTFYSPHRDGSVTIFDLDLLLKHIAGSQPLMLSMAVSFTVFGGLIGALVGLLLARRERLRTVEQEDEKKKVALETLKEIMVTLSHHLLNANMIIGGKVRQCRKATPDDVVLGALRVIEEEGRRIDAVIGALRKATEITVTRYTSDGTVRMIDLSKDLEEILDQSRKTD
jgi:hypothetical protein